MNQFNQYEALPGIKVNGELSLGENIADLGGLALAYETSKKYVKNPVAKDGFSPEQRFFIGFAQER